MTKKKKRPEVEHNETAGLISGKQVRAGGAPAPPLRGAKKIPVGPDGCAIVKTEVIQPRALNLRPMPPDPYTGEP